MGEPPGLVCPACDRRYAAGQTEPYRCDCGRPLELVETPSLPATPPTRPAGRGQWAFTDATGITLGEGWTPYVEDQSWNITFKLEYQSPTGSFKDRGAAATITRADALGVSRIVEDSSGNAGAAIATYATRAGIEAEIFVPQTATGSKLRMIERAGARVHRIDGDRAVVSSQARSAAEQPETWYASHAWRPSFLAGTATFGYEVAAELAPDALVVGVGNGTLLLGAYRGLTAARDAGWIDTLPRLIAAQPAGYAPLTETETPSVNALAEGMQITDPPRQRQLRRALEETGGSAVAITATETQRALETLREGGYQVEPSCAVAPAAVNKLREHGVLTSDETTVVPLTGMGIDPASTASDAS